MESTPRINKQIRSEDTDARLQQLRIFLSSIRLDSSRVER